MNSQIQLSRVTLFFVNVTMLFVAFCAFRPPVATAQQNQSRDNTVRGVPQSSYSPLPGEEIKTSSGKTMKVWSTRGPVETQQPAISQGSANSAPMGVIVDDRSVPRRNSATTVPPFPTPNLDAHDNDSFDFNRSRR